MSEKISRRNFLRTATLGAAAAGLLAGCGNSAVAGSTAASTAAGTYTAGTYSATATGINTTTPVTVTMTFNADTITNVQIDVANETKGYGADIADEMVKKILDAQSSEVDGHSGATITSDAIRKAAESCINQAKGVAVAPTEANKAETVVPDGLSVEEVESSVCELGDITPDETKDFDVVVVGAGAAGVPAAGWAAELGGHVALLQKQSIVVSQGIDLGGVVLFQIDGVAHPAGEVQRVVDALAAGGNVLVGQFFLPGGLADDIAADDADTAVGLRLGHRISQLLVLAHHVQLQLDPEKLVEPGSVAEHIGNADQTDPRTGKCQLRFELEHHGGQLLQGHTDLDHRQLDALLDDPSLHTRATIRSQPCRSSSLARLSAWLVLMYSRVMSVMDGNVPTRGCARLHSSWLGTRTATFAMLLSSCVPG